VEADRNLEQILHSICQKKWENEVVATKGKPHSIEWVFAQAQDCYFVRADPKEFENTYDNDFDDEPVSSCQWFPSDSRFAFFEESWTCRLVPGRQDAREDQAASSIACDARREWHQQQALDSLKKVSKVSDPARE